MKSWPSSLPSPARARHAIPLLAALMLTGCSSLLPTASVDTFDLRAPEQVSAPRGRTLQVLVPEPTTDRAFDTDRIVVRPSATEIAYFSGAQWADRLPRLVQSRLVETLEASGRFRAAGRPGQGLAIDRQVVVEIRAFDYESQAARVEIALSVKLMDDRTGRVMASRTFRTQEASGDSPKSAVAAFDKAHNRVLAEIVAWIATAG